jgi:hypothetical protein
MTVEPARTTGKCPCGQDLDPCGHHLQACQRRTSFMWAHQICQGFFVNKAASIPGVKVVTTTAHGLPHEMTTRSPGLCWSPVFRTAICNCLSLNVSFLS